MLSGDLRSTSRTNFFQSCTQILFDNVLKLKDPIPPSNNSSATNPSLSFEEQNAVHYVGGYVVASLKKDELDQEVLHGLDHLTEKYQEKKRLILLLGLKKSTEVV